MSGDVEKLASLVDDRCACLRQLHALGLRQLECIEVQDFSQLFRILGGKQRLLAEFQRIEGELAPFREQAPGKRQWPNEALRAHCAATARECERLLAEIVTQEQTSEQMLTAGRDLAVARLAGTQQASAARGAYADAGVGMASQLDLTCEG